MPNNRTQPPRSSERSALATILTAWLTAGTLDITAAIVYYPLRSGGRIATLLQGIASGALGVSAFQGGLRTAALGVGFHYLIAFIWTLLFFVAARKFEMLTKDLFLAGMVYGIVVWLAMNLIVLPLSNVRHGPFNPTQAVIGAVILMFCIGLPISAIVGRSVRGQTRALVGSAPRTGAQDVAGPTEEDRAGSH
jgi:hypothetical protein